MPSLLCATSNEEKFHLGREQFATHGITLEQIMIDIDEIQGEDSERIIRDKVQKAYFATGNPVLVTDDTWEIPGLRGFPGPYMKSVNHWFTGEDFVRLTSELEDRRVLLQQYVAYQDATQMKLFHVTIPGTLTRNPRGKSGPSNHKVVMLDADNGKTISEVYDAGIEHNPERFARRPDAWKLAAQWYKEYHG